MRYLIYICFNFIIAITINTSIACASQNNMNPLSVHVLDLQTGESAPGIEVTLEKKVRKNWEHLSSAITGPDGRISALYPDGRMTISAGDYRITFKTAKYFSKQKSKTIFPEIPIIVRLDRAENHVHIPLLLSQYGYSTYKGAK